MLHLAVETMTKRYGPRRVITDLSFKTTGGHVLVVTGPNGAGKSTLLRCLAGLERPSAGRIRWVENGLEWDRVNRRQRLGFLSPDLALYDELTGIENLKLFAVLREADSEQGGLLELLERVGLRERGGDRVGDYSSGMKQRLKWAFALQGSPDALLLDEPGVTLDSSGFSLAGELIGEARAAGSVVIVATNDTREIELGDEYLRLG